MTAPSADGGQAGQSTASGKDDDASSGAADGGAAGPEIGTPFTNGGSTTGGIGFGSGGTAPYACEKDEQVCKGSVLYGCNITRTGLELLVDCAMAAPNGFCDPEGENGPICARPVCEPGSAHCEGTTLYTCDKHGQYVGQVDVKACPSPPNPVPICEPNAWRCHDNLFQVCADNGLKWSDGAACQSGSHCADLGGSGECIANVCQAGATSCLGDHVGWCAADEQALSQVVHDCKADGQVCTIAGVCSASAEDQMGPAPDSTTDVKDWVDLLILDVHTDRTLTELAAHLDLATAGKVGWLVYEYENGGYTLKHEDTTQVAAADGTFASHLLDVQLRAGHRYVFGVRVDAQGSFYLQAVSASRRLSFANVVGSKGYDGDYKNLPNYLDPNDYESQLRITTAPPAP